MVIAELVLWLVVFQVRTWQLHVESLLYVLRIGMVCLSAAQRPEHKGHKGQDEERQDGK